MNKIQRTLKNQANKLSLYFTAGYPQLNDTLSILQNIQAAGVDLVEIGVPFSDPLADGPVIQEAGMKALGNGITLDLLFKQLKPMRESIHIPVVLMGYFNSVYVYGVDKFIEKCAEVGIDGIIFPDLPPEEYASQYAEKFKKHQLSNILLVTPQTSDERIQYIDQLSDGFIYVVSTASTTGANKSGLRSQQAYFERIKGLNLKNPLQIGFGISDADSFQYACSYANGAIIGSDFIRHISEQGIGAESIQKYVLNILK